SSDGRLVGSAAADGTACIWDATSGKRLWQLDHPKGVAWLAFRPGISELLTVDDDGKIYAWEAASGRPARVTPRVDSRIWYVAFSADGRRVVTADRDNHA